MHEHGEEVLDMMEVKSGELIEHVDAVVILCSTPSTGKTPGTCYLRMQKGNLHACEGIVREYLRRLESYEHGFHAEGGRSDRRHLDDS